MTSDLGEGRGRFELETRTVLCVCRCVSYGGYQKLGREIEREKVIQAWEGFCQRTHSRVCVSNQ